MALVVGKMKVKIRDDSWASRAWLVSSKKKKKKGRVDWWWSPTRICFSPYMIEGKPKICQKPVHVSWEHLCCLSQNPSLLGEASSWQKHFSPLILKSSLIIILSNIASMGCVVFRVLKLKVPRFCLSAFYNFLSLCGNRYKNEINIGFDECLARASWIIMMSWRWTWWWLCFEWGCDQT